MNAGAAIVPVGAEADSARLLNILKDLRPDTLILTPSYAEYLPGRCRQVLGVEAPDLGIKIIGCFAEPGAEDPVIRARLEKAWGATVYDGGGSSDAAPILFANCRERRGKHFLAADFGIVELIDPATQKSVDLQEGAEGEWVFTHLTREACPLVRFRAGDRIKVFTQACSCGRTGFRMLYLGRIDEMLLIRGVNVFPSAIKSVIEEFAPLTTGEIKILLDHPGPKVDPPLNIRVEYGSEVVNSKLDELRSQIEAALRLKLNFRASVEMVPPDSIPRFSGGMGKTKLVEILKP
jgi:phenylacetate-CoA ligase